MGPSAQARDWPSWEEYIWASVSGRKRDSLVHRESPGVER